MRKICKYPEITVKLVGQNGNAFAILGAVTHEMRKHNIPQVEIDTFLKEAQSGDYDNLLRTCMAWVEVR